MSRFGAPPTAAQTKGNILKSTEKSRWINFRVDEQQFEDVKIAALKARMTLGEYMIHAHTAYQQQEKG